MIALHDRTGRVRGDTIGGMPYLLALHVLGAVVWVGGMFFAHMMLRPGAATLEPAVRLALWRRVLGRFFVWVWLSVIVLLASGFAMLPVDFGSITVVPAYVRVMMTLGVVMTILYLYVYISPWQEFRRAVGNTDWAAAQRSLGQIRRVVGVNLILGLITVAVGGGGPYFG